MVQMDICIIKYLNIQIFVTLWFPPYGCYPENVPAPARPLDPERGRNALGSEANYYLVLLLGKSLVIFKSVHVFSKGVGVVVVVAVGWMGVGCYSLCTIVS